MLEQEETKRQNVAKFQRILDRVFQYVKYQLVEERKSSKNTI